jgi:hypothetical protein
MREGVRQYVWYVCGYIRTTRKLYPSMGDDLLDLVGPCCYDKTSLQQWMGSSPIPMRVVFNGMYVLDSDDSSDGDG